MGSFNIWSNVWKSKGQYNYPPSVNMLNQQPKRTQHYHIDWSHQHLRYNRSHSFLPPIVRKEVFRISCITFSQVRCPSCQKTWRKHMDSTQSAHHQYHSQAVRPAFKTAPQLWVDARAQSRLHQMRAPDLPVCSGKKLLKYRDINERRIEEDT